MNEKDEKIIETSSDKIDKTRKEVKAERKAAKKEKREQNKEVRRLKKEHKQRAAIVPESKRPIVCPPDCSDISNRKVWLGFLLRVFIIFVAVLAMALFITEACGFDMSADDLPADKRESYTGVLADIEIGYLAQWSLIFTVAFAAMSMWKYGYLVGIPGVVAIVALATLPNPVQRLYEAALAAYNGLLGHMKYMGFYTMDTNMVQNAPNHSGDDPTLVRSAVIVLILVIAAVFVPSLIKRVTLFPPAIFTVAVMIPIFTYNISRSNWAIALIIASFSGLIVMYVFDRIYIARPKEGQVGATDNIFGEEDAPEIPERVRNVREAKEAKRAEKARRRAEKKLRKKNKKTITVDQELSEYFADSKSKDKKIGKEKVRLTPAEKREAAKKKKEQKATKKAEKREDRNAMNKVARFHSNILLRRSAMGGFAGIGMFLLAFVLLVVPAISVDGSFKTIEAIDDRMDYYRDYITAYLMGDDPALDILSYEGQRSNFAPRNTDATPRYYTGKEILTIEANDDANIYLRGWIGTEYKDGAWYTADPGSEEFDRYREIFSTYIDSSELIYYNFFKLMSPDDMPDEDFDYVGRVKSVDKYGFIISQINMKRADDFDSRTLFMPSVNITRMASKVTGSGDIFLRGYGSADDSEISYANYFDGIYTSYRAGFHNDGYASVAMIPTWKRQGIEYNIADFIVEFNRARYAIESGRKNVYASDNTYKLTYSDGSTLEYSVIDELEDGTKYLLIPQPVGDALYEITPDGTVNRSMINTPEGEVDEFGDPVNYYAPKLDYAVRYYEVMTKEQRDLFDYQCSLLNYYTSFVYDVYTGTSDSEVIRDVLETIKSEATFEAIIADDDGITHVETVPADFSLAAERNIYAVNGEIYNCVTDRDVYVNRHQLVMAIIDYLTDEDNYTYSLTPKAAEEGNELDGVETFLTLTKEGYCVQYASAVVLMLREAGIPARFVEGYIAADMIKSKGVARYAGTVRDWNAHAWIEVWYDDIGWIQYEATPVYYNDMYYTGSGSSSVTRPWEDPDDGEEEEDENDEFSGLTDYEIEQLLKELEEKRRREIIRTAIIHGSITLAVISVIVLFFAIVFKRAKKSKEERLRLIKEIADASEKNGTVPSRESVRRIADMIARILEECNAAPRVGEFREEYALRIASEYGGDIAAPTPEEGLTEFEASRAVMREGEVLRMFNAIAAEEFGHGADVSAVPSMAKFYRRIHATLYRRRVNPLRRMWLYLFKREI